MIMILLHLLFGFACGFALVREPEIRFWTSLVGLVALLTLLVGDGIGSLDASPADKAAVWLMLIIPVLWGALFGLRFALSRRGERS
jgi:hypothetical protein